jgi:hypothetical protein
MRVAFILAGLFLSATAAPLALPIDTTTVVTAIKAATGR